MRQLFAKIYLSVLLAVGLSFVLGFFIADWMRDKPNGPFGDRQHRNDRRGPIEDASGGPPPNMRPPFDVEFTGVEDHLSRSEIDQARAAALRLSEQKDLDVFIVDNQGQDIAGREVPKPLLELIPGAQATSERGFFEARDTVHISQAFIDDSGVSYTLLASLSKRPYFWRHIFRGALMHFCVVVVALGVVCFFLARYMTHPVVKLRAIVRKFAEGDLNQRIGDSLGKRRDELADLGRDFDQMAIRIANLLSSQRRLLQDISHELRSPLARHGVALELTRERSGPEARSALDRVEREADRLNELVGELLTLTKLEADSRTVEFQVVAIDRVITGIVEDADFEARSNDKSVILTTLTSCQMKAAAELIRRAVENVVRNAILHTPPKSVVEVSLDLEDAYAVVRVRDHGPGVPEAQLSEIFRPFYRVNEGRDRQTGGAGLGLAIADRAARSHNGSIIAHNADDGGLIVEIKLPRLET